MDTLASVIHYTDSSRMVLVIDDTPALSTSYADIRRLSSDIEVIKAPARAPGDRGGLWVKLSAGYRWVLDRYHPGMILRLDADSLILGSGIEAAAEAALARDPGVGLLGSYRLGPDGRFRDFSPPAHVLRTETGFRGLRHPKLRSRLRTLARVAQEHGYIYGEHALGAAYIHSYPAARRLYEKGWLSHQPWFAPSKLGDDHIMAILTIAAGYRLADFGGPADPLALKWHGLPAHPADLLANGKLITHSVRSWCGLDERQIRGMFAAARGEPAG